MSDTSTLNLQDATTIQFFPLQRRQEEGEWLVGREETATYVSLPLAGVEIIDLFLAQKTVHDVKMEMAARYGEEPDLQPFIEAMLECGFIERLGMQSVAVQQQERHLFWRDLQPRHVKWLFSPLAKIFYSAVVLGVAFAWAWLPAYIPRPSDFFYHSSLTVVLLSLFVLGWISVAWHEFWHFLAARSEGVQADFSLSWRLNYLVAQTDITGVWMIPPKNRYKVYFAGMIGTSLLIAIFQVFLVLHDGGYIKLSGIVYKLLKALIFEQFWSILWQFQFNMRTDIYYVIANILKCKNLHEDARSLFKVRLGNWLTRWPTIARWKSQWISADVSMLAAHEQRGIRLYLPFYIFGTCVVLCVFAFRTLPILWQFLFQSVKALANGWHVHPAAFYDAVVFIVLTVLNYGLLGLLIWRDRRRQRHVAKGVEVVQHAV